MLWNTIPVPKYSYIVCMRGIQSLCLKNSPMSKIQLAYYALDTLAIPKYVISLICAGISVMIKAVAITKLRRDT
jgi:hypothetical protein